MYRRGDFGEEMVNTLEVPVAALRNQIDHAPVGGSIAKRSCECRAASHGKQLVPLPGMCSCHDVPFVNLDEAVGGAPGPHRDNHLSTGGEKAFSLLESFGALEENRDAPEPGPRLAAVDHLVIQ